MLLKVNSMLRISHAKNSALATSNTAEKKEEKEASEESNSNS